MKRSMNILALIIILNPIQLHAAQKNEDGFLKNLYKKAQQNPGIALGAGVLTAAVILKKTYTSFYASSDESRNPTSRRPSMQPNADQNLHSSLDLNTGQSFRKIGQRTQRSLDDITVMRVSPEIIHNMPEKIKSQSKMPTVRSLPILNDSRSLGLDDPNSRKKPFVVKAIPLRSSERAKDCLAVDQKDEVSPKTPQMPSPDQASRSFSLEDERQVVEAEQKRRRSQDEIQHEELAGALHTCHEESTLLKTEIARTIVRQIADNAVLISEHVNAAQRNGKCNDQEILEQESKKSASKKGSLYDIGELIQITEQLLNRCSDYDTLKDKISYLQTDVVLAKGQRITDAAKILELTQEITRLQRQLKNHAAACHHDCLETQHTVTQLMEFINGERSQDFIQKIKKELDAIKEQLKQANRDHEKPESLVRIEKLQEALVEFEGNLPRLIASNNVILKQKILQVKKEQSEVPFIRAVILKEMERQRKRDNLEKVNGVAEVDRKKAAENHSDDEHSDTVAPTQKQDWTRMVNGKGVGNFEQALQEDVSGNGAQDIKPGGVHGLTWNELNDKKAVPAISDDAHVDRRRNSQVVQLPKGQSPVAHDKTLTEEELKHMRAAEVPDIRNAPKNSCRRLRTNSLSVPVNGKNGKQSLRAPLAPVGNGKLDGVAADDEEDDVIADNSPAEHRIEQLIKDEQIAPSRFVQPHTSQSLKDWAEPETPKASISS